jgi:dTDP-4-dehydrorhamnose 3,5-epimerase
MEIRELSVADAYEISPVLEPDERGIAFEWFRSSLIAEFTGHTMNVVQSSICVLRRGSVRGVHYADLRPGQAKYVTAIAGRVLDFVVDVRVGSPTFGQWDSVVIDDVDRRAVYIAEGLGHCFVALSDNAAVAYLISAVYRPGTTGVVDPLDPELGLIFPPEAGELVVSPEDVVAPGLSEAAARGLLPSWSQAKALYQGRVESEF